MTNLYQRKICKKIEKYLKTDDVLVLYGARQVGKTSIMKYLMADLEKKKEPTFYIDLEDFDYLDLLNDGLKGFLQHLRQQGIDLKKKLFLFIDEIQYLNNPSNLIKLIHDHHPQIKLIVSGSSSFDIKNKFQDSLVGRTVNFSIYALSFTEFLYFKKQSIDLNEPLDELSEQTAKELYQEYVLYGAYPKIVLTDDREMKETYMKQIIDSYVRKDIKDLANVRDIMKFNKLLHLLARQSGQLLNVTELSNTIGIAKQTVEHYLFILENTYIIKLLYPYAKNIRSELFKTPKIFFYDSGLANILKYKTFPQEIFGEDLENTVFGDLIKNYGSEKLNFWRTQDKKEIDFILDRREGSLPIEVKLNTASLNHSVIQYFLDKYQLEDWYCMTLEKHQESKHYIYPWELKRMV